MARTDNLTGRRNWLERKLKADERGGLGMEAEGDAEREEEGKKGGRGKANGGMARESRGAGDALWGPTLFLQD